MEDEFKDNLFITEEKNSNTEPEELDLKFGNIEYIQKKTEDSFDNLLKSNEQEFLKLISVVSINQILLDPNYCSKIIEKRIKKLLNFNGFFLNFKNELKLKKKNEQQEKVNDEEKPKGETNKKEKSKYKKNKGNTVGNNKIDEIMQGEKKEESKKREEEKEGEKKKNEDVKKKNEKKLEEYEKEEKKNKAQKDKEEKKSKFQISINSSDLNISSSSSIQQKALLNAYQNNTENDFLFEKIIKELNSNTEEIIDGKDYETRVKSYLKIFFECCTEEDLIIESNPARILFIKFIKQLN